MLRARSIRWIPIGNSRSTTISPGDRSWSISSRSAPSVRRPPQPPDIEGWYGGDFHRLRYRLEGDAVSTRAAEGEAALLYSRLVGPWVELQVGLGAEGTLEDDSGWEARIEAGVEAVVPYDFDVEAHLRIGHRGRVSARVTGIKELLLSQRLIAQARAETTVALQASPALGAPAGLEEVEAGLRLRYEVLREVAPYVGVQWGGGLVPPDGAGAGSGFVQRVRAVAGLRLWY
ncbi:MAG: copper resistance protein B [Myxococcota bacterium]